MPQQQLTYIGKYPVSRRLGHGAMGEVWLARHPELDMPVAIKTLAVHLVGKDKAFIDRFLQEARTAAKISHPNIVRVYDAGTDGNVHFIVMEYVDGGTVKEIIDENRPMPPVQAIQIITAVAEGLKAAAEHSIVHRDIKPDNIMIDSKGAVKLCDLGLAKETGSESGMTATGASFGSPAFMAPEQAINARDVDARADIYSLGATLYNMVTGEVPFTGQSAVVVMLKHMKEPLPDPRTKVANLPDNICAVIRKMMAKEPAERYQSAAQLLEDLHAIKMPNASAAQLPCGQFSASTRASAQTLPGTPTDPTSEKTQALSPPTRSHRKILTIVILVLGLLLLAGIVLLGVSSLQRNERSQPQSVNANGTTEPANVSGVSEPDESTLQSTSLPDPQLDRGGTSSIPQNVQEEDNRESRNRAEEAMRKAEEKVRREEKRAEKSRRKAEEKARKKKKR